MAPGEKRGGRPKKYATAEEARRANLDGNRRRRQLQQSRLPPGPANFITYEPPLCKGIPIDTPPSIGLRTGPNVPIPQEHGTALRDVRQSYCDVDPPQPTSLPMAEQSQQIAAEIKRIMREEEEDHTEQKEYEMEIAEVLARMPMASLAGDVERRVEREEQGALEQSRFSMGASIDEPIIMDNNGNSVASYSPHNDELASAQGSHANDQPSQVLALETPSSKAQSRGSGGSKSRRSTSFPIQKNNLLSWMKPALQQRPTVDRDTPLTLLAGMNRTLAAPTPSPVPSSMASPAPSTPTPQNVSGSSLAASSREVTIGAIASPTPPPPLVERTAIKLAKQLRSFQGCTHEQHGEADQLHQENHHQHANVHAECSSLAQITTLLRGSYNNNTPLPDVLSSSKLIKRQDVSGLSYQAAFEGTSPTFVEADKSPRSLCLAQHYSASKKGRRPKTTFDIDSICCFPSSLAVARQGIKWMPKAHAFLNLSADIHFGLKIPGPAEQGEQGSRYMPLHKIPHYCFGTLLGMESLCLFIFFPALHAASNYEHSTYLSKQDQQLWYDEILAPCIGETIQSSNIVQYYPISARVASFDSTAKSAESLARKDMAREQLLNHPLQPQYLDPLWSCILETIVENPRFHRFQGATLFMHSKNTKLEQMGDSLTNMYDAWKEQWSSVADPQFYNEDRTFVDLAKQTTSEDSALLSNQIHMDHEAEVYLWKKCCLDAYAQTRTIHSTNGSRTKGNAKRTTYPWAMMRDSIGQTMFAVPHGQENQDGLIYSQFYALIKTPFDSAKVYTFDNDSVENLALDPGYVRSLQQEGGGVTFSKAVCEFAYLHSKQRAHANLIDNQRRSYGIREEHRISLAMMEEIYQQWHQWDLYDADELDDIVSPLPYYIVPTQELLSFLYAQINKYCFLFEHVLAHTARAYSLPETIVMVIALRALRFCYGSNLLQRESLLYKDRWEQLRGHNLVVKEGLGLKETIHRHGLGWFLPKFKWATWRLAAPHGDNILVGNMLVHEEYKRRWRAVKDLRDVFVRFNQAASWYDQYDMQSHSHLRCKWLEYLLVLNLEQFDLDVWRAALKAHKRSPELAPDVAQQQRVSAFCYQAMKTMFVVNGAVCPPHTVTGNKMRFDKVMDLLHVLFLWDDKEDRLGWDSKPYRVILQKTFELIDQRLGHAKAKRWLNEFLHLVRLTHWILPYPSNVAFIASTKTSRSQGLQGRMMWFSAIYSPPNDAPLPPHWPAEKYHSLLNILRYAQRDTFGGAGDTPEWETSQLIAACRHQGLLVHGQEEYWSAGKRSDGIKGFRPVYVRSQPPKLKMLERIRGKTLDELEDLMVAFTREGVAHEVQDEAAISSQDGGGDGEGDAEATDDISGTDPAPKGAAADQTSEEDLFGGTLSSTPTVSSGSIFRLYARKK